MNRFEGRTYVVTGGATGIGLAAVERIADEGASVAVWDAPGSEGVHGGMAEGAVATLECTWREPASVQHVAEETARRFGRVDGLVNTTRVLNVDGGVEACSVEEWDETIATNLTSIFLAAKYLLPSIRTSPHPAIVNLVSAYGFRGFPGECAYDASQGAVVNLTRHMAVQCAAEGIRVNGVAEGEIDTPILQALIGGAKDPAQERRAIEGAVPMHRIGRSEEVAAAICYLLSDDASYTTGTIIHVEGGLLAGPAAPLAE